MSLFIFPVGVMHILDQEAFGLADQLKPLSLERRRQVVAKACALACSTLRDLEPEIADLVQSAVTENTLTQAQAERSRLLAESSDERYFTLQEQGETKAIWIEWFYKARLLTAIWNSFGGSSWSDSADAIYELCKTRDDPSEIIALVRAELESASKTG